MIVLLYYTLISDARYSNIVFYSISCATGIVYLTCDEILTGYLLFFLLLLLYNAYDPVLLNSYTGMHLNPCTLEPMSLL